MRDGCNQGHSLRRGAILLLPIHLFVEQLGWGCRGRLVGAEEKGSFEEVTDGARGTGQRKFARCCYEPPTQLLLQRHRGSG